MVCPGSGNLQVDLLGGGDDVTFVSQGFDCFNAYELNLGEGANTVNLSGDCGDVLTGPATINSGGGPDVLTAGSQAFTFNAGGGTTACTRAPATTSCTVAMAPTGCSATRATIRCWARVAPTS